MLPLGLVNLVVVAVLVEYEPRIMAAVGHGVLALVACGVGRWHRRLDRGRHARAVVDRQPADESRVTSNRS